MLFGTKFHSLQCDYDDVIERVNKFKYLGVVHDPHLSWNDHVQFLSDNISKRIGVICRVKYYLHCSTVNMLAKALVFPHFDTAVLYGQIALLILMISFKFSITEFDTCLRAADIRTPVDKLMKDFGWVN